MRAILISIGTELLLGDILNTNAQYLSKQLAILGFDVFKQATIGDNYSRAKKMIEDYSKEADLIIITGGLGSTNDDITKRILLDLAGNKELNKSSMSKIKKHFSSVNGFDKAMEDNEKVATFPKKARIFNNSCGTADGFSMVYNDCEIISMPGPPREMTTMFEDHISKYLQKKTNKIILSRKYNVAFMGEWEMSSKVKDLLDGSNPSLAPYATDNGAFLRATAKADTYEEANLLLDKLEKKILSRLKDKIYAIGDKSREEAIVKILTNNGLKISTAESLTGGLISSSIVDISGASKVIEQAYVVYADSAKEKVLSVDEELLSKYSAVSREVCLAMLKGLRKKSNADICITTTGYAGPDGDVGHVFIGIYYKDYCVFEKKFDGSRNRIRSKVKNYALDKLWEILVHDPEVVWER